MLTLGVYDSNNENNSKMEGDNKTNSEIFGQCQACPDRDDRPPTVHINQTFHRDWLGWEKRKLFPEQEYKLEVQ